MQIAKGRESFQPPMVMVFANCRVVRSVALVGGQVFRKAPQAWPNFKTI